MTVCFEKSIWLLERCPHGKTHSIVQVLNTSPEKEENIYFNIQLSGTKYIHRVPKPVFRVLTKHGEGIMEKEKLYDSGQVRWSKNYRGLKTFLGLVFSWPVASVACELRNTYEAQQKCTGDKNRHRAITYTNTLIISIQCVKRGSQATWQPICGELGSTFSSALINTVAKMVPSDPASWYSHPWVVSSPRAWAGPVTWF